MCIMCTTYIKNKKKQLACSQSYGNFCTQSKENIYKQGCLNVTEKFVKEHATIIGGAGIGVACLMLLGMIFSCSLFKMIE
ncbi:hypothetical protein C0J52_01908 [Blattella germanica]|nr:hypothetical protein C0J52_01908 [Blattella germanica]